MLDVFRQQIEGVLRVRLHEFQLRKDAFEIFYVVAVLNFIQTILRLPRFVMGSHQGLIGTGVPLDRQERVHGARD